VLLGVAIALVVELCGVSSLAFAVGVYLPLSSSAPICAGGLTRYVVEKIGKRRGLAQASELESEMSPGVLLSTGYIAGGTLAGVLIAFLTFSDTAVNAMAVWQYRTMPVAAVASFDAQCRALAEEELGTNASQKQLERMAAEIRDLNESKLRLYVRVPKGMTLNLPENQRYEAPADAALIEVAEQALGSGDKASLLFDLNENRLKLPEGLPSGVLLKIPQRNAPALIAFALLAGLLAAVGAGWIMKPSENVV
jgi:hypothetical protein